MLPCLPVSAHTAQDAELLLFLAICLENLESRPLNSSCLRANKRQMPVLCQCNTDALHDPWYTSISTQHKRHKSPKVSQCVSMHLLTSTLLLVNTSAINQLRHRNIWEIISLCLKVMFIPRCNTRIREYFFALSASTNRNFCTRHESHSKLAPDLSSSPFPYHSFGKTQFYPGDGKKPTASARRMWVHKWKHQRKSPTVTHCSNAIKR